MKHMKKSMFITTLAMVVVLVVALSTATFAWYTAQSTLTSTETSVYTATSTSASIALSSVSSNVTTVSNTSIDITMGANNVENGINPMIPAAALTTYTAATTTGAFKTASINADGTFKANGANATPTQISKVKAGNEAEATQTNFFVINTNANAATGVTVLVSNITGYYPVSGITDASKFTAAQSQYTTLYKASGRGYTAAAEYEENTAYFRVEAALTGALRVAIFNNAGNVVGVFSSTASTYQYGTITEGASYSSIATTGDTVATAQTYEASLGAQTASECHIIAWFEGSLLTNQYAGGLAQFTVTFNAVAAA